MHLNLQERLILVTGGASGVGRAIVDAVSAEGAHVLLHYRTSEEAAKAHALELGACGARVTLLNGDISSYADVMRMRDTIADIGPLYGVVNNAGFGQYKRLYEYQPAEWQREIDTCYLGVIHLAYLLVPLMSQQGAGKFINIVGDSARTGDRNLIISASARGAAVSFVKSLAAEVGSQGVQCNTVSLGLVEKPDAPLSPELARKIVRQYPAGRLGTPNDVASAVLYLLSSASDWVTGQVFSVDGGFTMIG